MSRLAVIAIVLGALVLAPQAATASCPSRDARAMLAEAGQGFNGRVLAVRADRIVVLAESRYDPRTIGFGARVTVHGTRLPATPDGRIGLAARREGGRWRATACDVVPGARMALALSGRTPCPAPRARFGGIETTGRRVAVRLLLGGDVTALRLRWGTTERRRAPMEPGVTLLTEDLRFATAGSRTLALQVEGGAGPGCGRTVPRRSSVVRRTVTVR